jgi:hypothetical protein
MSVVSPRDLGSAGFGFLNRENWRFEFAPAAERSAGLFPDPSCPIADPSKNQHPSAAQAKFLAMLDQTGEDIHTEDDQRKSDDSWHPLVDPRRKMRADKNGNQAKSEDNQGVAERIERPEENRVPAIFLRAGDVGDRGDVVPINAVTKAETENGNDESETESLSGNSGGSDHG